MATQGLIKIVDEQHSSWGGLISRMVFERLR
jgi:hypothetical protein